MKMNGGEACVRTLEALGVEVNLRTLRRHRRFLSTKRSTTSTTECATCSPGTSARRRSWPMPMRGLAAGSAFARGRAAAARRISSLASRRRTARPRLSCASRATSLKRRRARDVDGAGPKRFVPSRDEGDVSPSERERATAYVARRLPRSRPPALSEPTHMSLPFDVQTGDADVEILEDRKREPLPSLSHGSGSRPHQEGG